MGKVGSLMLVKKGRHSEISMNYKLKILAKKVNLLNLRSLVSLKRPQIKFFYIFICETDPQFTENLEAFV